jgi:hypothetical protein
MQADIKPGRRLNINGDITVWQRGTSISNNTASTPYSADRWETYRTGFQTGITTSRQTGINQFKYCARVQRVSGNTATNFMFFNQPLESNDSFKVAGKYVTLSFWARAGANFSSNINNRLISQVTTGTGTDQNFRNAFTGSAAPAYQEFTMTTSWAYYTISGLTASNINQIGVQFYYVPSGTAGANDYFEITGVQLEIGSAPSEFEFEPYETTLGKCQRYYYMVKNAIGNNPALFRTNAPFLGNLYHCNFTLPVPPRITTGITSFIFASGTQIHKPGVRWDSANSISFEAMPGNSTNYQMWVTPGVDDGASYYVCYLYGVGIVYNGEL